MQRRGRMLGFIAKCFLFEPHFLAADLGWKQAMQLTGSSPHTQRLVRPNPTFSSLMVLINGISGISRLAGPEPWGRGQHHLSSWQGQNRSRGGAHSTLALTGASPGSVSGNRTWPGRPRLQCLSSLIAQHSREMLSLSAPLVLRPCQILPHSWWWSLWHSPSLAGPESAPWCWNCSLKERGQTQSSGAWLCFLTSSTTKRCCVLLSEMLCWWTVAK